VRSGSSDHYEIAARNVARVAGQRCELRVCMRAGPVDIVVERAGLRVVDDVTVGVVRFGAVLKIDRIQGAIRADPLEVMCCSLIVSSTWLKSMMVSTLVVGLSAALKKKSWFAPPQTRPAQRRAGLFRENSLLPQITTKSWKSIVGWLESVANWIAAWPPTPSAS
jgi:hypothetical protein